MGPRHGVSASRAGHGRVTRASLAQARRSANRRDVATLTDGHERRDDGRVTCSWAARDGRVTGACRA